MICISLFQPPGTCGADFLSSDNISNPGTAAFGAQAVLPMSFKKCGRLRSYNVTANCLLQGNQGCNIVFQLWRPTGTSHLTLINSVLNTYNLMPPHPSTAVQVSLSFPLDMQFSAGDMVGFTHSSRRPLEVSTASAGGYSYLQWSSVSTLHGLLAIKDADPVATRLPILNVEGNYTLATT